MAASSHFSSLNHDEWVAAVHAAFERERERQAVLAAENRLTAAESRWWATPAERAEAVAHYRRVCARAA